MDVAQDADVAVLEGDTQRSRIRFIMLAVGIFSAGLVFVAVAIDEGEVVKLQTFDAQRHGQETDLWIVDLDSGIYLRSASPDSRWLARIRANPDVILARNGYQQQYRAVQVEGVSIRGDLNRAMAEKYGFADRLWGRLSDRSSSVPVVLLPLDAAGHILAVD